MTEDISDGPIENRYPLMRVLKAFADADARESLFWKFEGDEGLRLFALCSDTFDWGSADLEEITPETIPVLEQTLEDLREIDSAISHFTPELYACRIRKMRPMRAYCRVIRSTYPDAVVDKLFALFNACGPARDPASEG